MLFNTLEFLLFFPVVLVLFYLLPHKYRWLLLLVASYYFYMGWNPAYVLLLVLTTTVDFYVANRMQDYADKKDRRPWLLLSLFFNIGLLMYFKYYNFFIDNINSLSDSGLRYMQFLLPVGISFYTFQEMGYVIDVYRGEIRAERHWGRFALFVSFFLNWLPAPSKEHKTSCINSRKRWYSIITIFLSAVSILYGAYLKKWSLQTISQ